MLVAALVGTDAQAGKLAPGFYSLPKDAKVVVAPLDIELFSVSAGGVLEPRADWTAAAQAHMRQALNDKAQRMGLANDSIKDSDADDVIELINLHSAVARSIALHHAGRDNLRLPTQEGQLDWSFGDALQPLQERSGARYALFTWVRDSYASAQRKAMMAGMALLGVVVTGGSQVGYASLVDLQTGQVLWFNKIARASGDLREDKAAAESVDALLAGFPAAVQ